MADNNAQFGVEIPPVKGINEAIKDFDRLTESVKKLGAAVGDLGNKLQNTKPGAATADMQKMQGAAGQLLSTMGPLGQQAMIMQQRFGLLANAFRSISQMGPAMAVGLGIAVVALIGLAAAFMAVKKAIDITMDAIKQAAAFQGLSDTFSDFIGNTKAATAELEKMREVWHGTGVFKLADIIEAGTRMRSLGGGIEHVAELTDALAKAALAGTGDIKGMAEAFASLMAGRIRGAPSLDQLTLIRAIAVQTKGPMETLDAAISRTTLAIKKHEIATEDMAAALVKAGQAGGIFAGEVQEEANMFDGAVKVMGQRWDEFLLEFGTPIIDALTPIIQDISDAIDRIIPKAEGWGEAIGGVITKFSELLGVIDRIYTRLNQIAGLLPALKVLPIIGPAISAYQFGHDMIAPETGPGGIPKPAGIDTIKRPGPMPGKLGDWVKTFEDKGGGGKESAFDQYKADLQLLSDYWEEYSIIQAKATTATEAQYRSMQAVTKLIPTLGDPIAHLDELTKGLGPDDAALVRWKVYDEVATRALHHIEDKAKANQATMTEVWQAGLKKMTDSWGSFQEQMINGIGEIGNALVSDITGGLVDILNGTKSVKDGFRDMAIAIINDIERIMIKMLVQLAIQQLLAAFGGAGTAVPATASQNAALGPLLEGATAGMARGGMVGGTGPGDHVPALLEPGEFVIPRDSAERIGYSKLEEIRKMEAGGRVTRGRHAYGKYETGRGVRGGDTYFDPGTGLWLYYDETTGQWLDSNTGMPPEDDPTINPPDLPGTGEDPTPSPRRIKLPRGGGGGGPARTSGGRPGDPGGVDTGRRIIGFDDQGNPIRLDDLSGGPRGFNLGDINRGDRPGFPSDIGANRFFGAGPTTHVLVPNEYRGPGGYTTAPGAYTGPAGTIFTSGGTQYVVSSDPGRPGYIIMSGPNAGKNVTELPGGATAPSDVDRSGEPGMGPGDYNMAGPGGGFGSRGVGFNVGGSGTVGQFYTAIGFDQLGRGGGPVSMAQWGTNYSRHWAAQQMKGILISRQDFGLLKHAMPGLPGYPGGMGGSYEHYVQQTRAVQAAFQARGYVFAPGQGAGGPVQITHHGHLPPTKTFHEGGIVDRWAEYQSGGTVRRGEGVFTPEQMASLAPAGGTQVNQITIAINNQGGRTDARAEGTGLNDRDAREMARAMLAVCKAQIEKEKRSGGSLYIPRSQRGG